MMGRIPPEAEGYCPDLAASRAWTGEFRMDGLDPLTTELAPNW